MIKSNPAALVRSSVLGILAFNLANLIFTISHFASLGIWQVAIVATAFMSVGLLSAWWLLKPELASTQSWFRLRWSYLFIAVSWAFGLWLLSFVRHHISSRLYFPDFPLASIDQGVAVHQDTVFNSSLIQSIMNFGYPSTALNGTPFTSYHVLTHYFEALVYKVAGLDALESAGLLFRVTAVATLTVVSAFAIKTIAKRNIAANLLTLAILVPVLLSGWHVVYSQPLWLTTILLILFSVVAYRNLTTPSPTAIQLALLGVMSLILALGKVSTGLVFFAVVFGILLLRNLKSARIWLAAALSGLALLPYAIFIASDRSIGSSESINQDVSAMARIQEYLLSDHNWLAPLVALFVVTALAKLVFRIPLGLQLLTVQSVLILGILALVAIGQNSSDVYYFCQAAFYTCCLIVLLEFKEPYPDRSAGSAPFQIKRTWIAGFWVLAALSTLAMESVPLSFFNLTPRTLGASVKAPFEPIPVISNAGFLASLKTELDAEMKQQGFSLGTTRLLISREVFEAVAKTSKQPYWSLGMTIYAATSVPLQNGVTELHNYYGFSRYGAETLALSQGSINPETLCSGSINVIELKSVQPISLQTICEAN